MHVPTVFILKDAFFHGNEIPQTLAPECTIPAY